MAAKLKTFVTSNGLMDFIVATTSKTKALQLWGVGQDLFKFGQAHETEDPAVVALAEAEPHKVIQRPASTQAAIRALQPATVEKRAKPTPSPPPERPTAKVIKLETARPARPSREPAGPTPAQLRKVAEAEEKLAAARATHKETIGALVEETTRVEGELETVAADLARLRKEQAALEKKQARLKGEQESAQSRSAQETKRFAAQEGILKARLDAAKSAF